MNTRALEPQDTQLARRIIFGLSSFVAVAVAVVVYVLPPSDGGRLPGALATVNAALNGAAGCFLVAGYVFVRRGAIPQHRRCMLIAFGLSSLFLVTYLAHHAQVGSVPFTGQGWLRVLYFSILVPHILLATVIIPLALFTIYRGWTNRIASHRRVARWTLPLWLYVSFSGVAIYFMLYHL